MRRNIALAALVLMASAAVSVHAQTPSAANTYQVLVSLHADDQKILYVSLSGEMKAAVWKVHLNKALSAHREWSTLQRNVVAEAIALIDSGLFLAVNPDGSTALGPEVALLEQQIRAAFPRDVASATFAHMGGRPVATADTPACECSVLSDWCDSNYTLMIECSRLPHCSKTGGCGTFWVYDCDGTCQS